MYLETTLFGYYFEPERDAHADTVKLFSEIEAGRYQAYTSTYTLQELAAAPPEKFMKMQSLIKKYGIAILEDSDETDNLADTYQKQGALPPSSTVDAQHIAVAAVNDMDMILSLNFKHIVRKKTEEMTALINAGLGYRAVEIRSPMEVVNRENT